MEKEVYSYINTFHMPLNPYSQKILTCDTPPVEYKGYQIFHRVKSANKDANVYDIVKDGKCIGMYAGPNGARRKIDSL